MSYRDDDGFTQNVFLQPLENSNVKKYFVTVVLVPLDRIVFATLISFEINRTNSLFIGSRTLSVRFQIAGTNAKEVIKSIVNIEKKTLRKSKFLFCCILYPKIIEKIITPKYIQFNNKPNQLKIFFYTNYSLTQLILTHFIILL